MTRRRAQYTKSSAGRLLARLLCILVLPLGIFASETVTLTFRDSACVNDTLITLGDITARIDAPTPQLREQLAAVVVGESAPAGFTRYLTSDDAIVYALRPRFPAIVFAATRHTRLHIATAFKEHTLAEFEPQILAAAYAGVPWKKEECTISLQNSTKAWRCLNKPFTISVEAPRSTVYKGNTAMKLCVTQGTKKYNVPIVVKIRVEAQVLVATTRINRDEALSSANCELRKTDITELKYQTISDLSSLTAVRAARMLAPGTVLHEKLVKKIPVVQTGDQVFIHVTAGSVSVAVMGIARQDGASGDKIWVENSRTHKLLHAKIKTQGNVTLLSTREAL